MRCCMKNPRLSAALFFLFLPAGCSGKETGAAVAVADPASGHCVKKGGRLEIVKDGSGEKGMCHLPDGTVIEEWELFRDDNPDN